MHKIAPLLFISLLALSACSSPEDGEKAGSSASSVSSSSVSVSSLSSSSVSSLSSSSDQAKAPVTPLTLAGELSGWLTAWRAMIPNLNLTMMQKVSTKTMQPDIVDPLVEHEDILDEETMVDYPILFPAEDGNTVVYISPNLEPDTEVAIIKPHENVYERHLSCGTPCAFDDAVWVDNERFAVTGFSEYHPANGEERCTVDTQCTFVPTLYIFDLDAKTVSLYQGPEVDAEIFLGNRMER